MHKIYLSALIFIFAFASVIFCQSSSEHIQNGFTSYQRGDYQAALNSFNSALQTSSSIDESRPLLEESTKQYSDEQDKSYVRESEKKYTETTKKDYIRGSDKTYVETSAKKYYDEPLEYQGDEPAKIYLYRGRTYLQLGNKQAALNDFDKAVSLDPALSEVYFRRALAEMDVDPDKACPDLLAAIERGHQSAKELYDLICK